jgi:hypothetical protein
MSATGPITATADWREILASPAERDHTVQLYSDLGFLTSAVSHYAAAGLERGEAVIFVATPAHREAFAQRLGARGFDVRPLCERGQLTVLDAAETLSRFMVNGSPKAGLFAPLMHGVMDRAQAGGRYPRIRAYGEMVNLLWQRGELAAALRLEELWNDLGKTRPFALHCAYAMDAFDRATCCGALGRVHHVHSCLIPVEDYRRYEAAVSRAMSEVLGPVQATLLRPELTARHRSGSSMPEAQVAVLGLAEVLPRAADVVLERARRYYAGAASAA